MVRLSILHKGQYGSVVCQLCANMIRVVYSESIINCTVSAKVNRLYYNNNNCLKSNIQCIEIRVQWTVHLGSSHMHVSYTYQCQSKILFLIIQGRTFTTHPGPDAVFTTCPDPGALLQHTQVRTQFYHMPRSGRNFTTYLGHLSKQD